MPDFDFEEQVTITEMTKLVRLSYLQTIAVLDDSIGVSRLAGESQGSRSQVRRG